MARRKLRSQRLKEKANAGNIYKADTSYRERQQKLLDQGRAARAQNRAEAAASERKAREAKSKSKTLIQQGTSALGNLERGKAKDLAASIEGTLARISPAFDRRQRLKGIKKAKKSNTLAKSPDIFDLPDLEGEDYTKVSMLKKGGRVKSRKRAALRGHRAELRGG